VLTFLATGNWSYAMAAHLINRAAFGGTPAEIEAAHAKGLARAVRDLIDPTAATTLPPPSWAQPQNIREIRMAIREEKNDGDGRNEKRREFRRMEGENILDLRRWWLNQMMITSAPLVEKMALFWHGQRRES
jgi:uncharacterized protein (DUF1800 family)